MLKSLKKFFQNAQTFFCLKYRYSMGILTYETFLLDVLFKKKLRTRKDDFKFPRGHMNFRGVNDPGETVSAGSLTPRKIRINFFSRFRGVIDPGEIVSAGSLNPGKRFQRGH
jgi:hypothetical protein